MVKLLAKRINKNKNNKTRKKPYASVWEAVRNEHGSNVAGQSRDRRPTVQKRFLEVSNNLELF